MSVFGRGRKDYDRIGNDHQCGGDPGGWRHRAGVQSGHQRPLPGDADAGHRGLHPVCGHRRRRAGDDDRHGGRAAEQRHHDDRHQLRRGFAAGGVDQPGTADRAVRQLAEGEDGQRPGKAVRGRFCLRLPDGLHRSHGRGGLHPGRHLGGTTPPWPSRRCWTW